MAETRRTSTRAFKAQAVELITARGKSVAEVARDLDHSESLLRGWRRSLAEDGDHAFPGKGNPPAHEEEPRRLRAEVKRLTMGRGVRKGAAAFFAGESSWGTTSSRVTGIDGRSGSCAGSCMSPSAATTPGGEGRKSARARRRGALIVSIKAIHAEVKARYGSPRVHAELIARGEPCCANTVARLMHLHGIAAKTKRKFRCTTDSNHALPVAANVLDRQFVPMAADRAWTADITYIATGEGWRYLAAVEDLYLRRIVGWSMGLADRQPAGRRRPGDGPGRSPDRGGAGGPLGPSEPVRQRALPGAPGPRGCRWSATS